MYNILNTINRIIHQNKQNDSKSYFQYDYILKLCEINFQISSLKSSVMKLSNLRDLSKSTAIHDRVKADNLSSLMVDLKMTFIVCYLFHRRISSLHNLILALLDQMIQIIMILIYEGSFNEKNDTFVIVKIVVNLCKV